MTDLTVSIQGPGFKKSPYCEAILAALPAWFGIPAANQQYLDEINQLPTFLAFAGGDVIGFLSIKPHFPKSAEIYVTGILPQHHRHGFGRALLSAAEAYLRSIGVRYLQVKTLSPAHPDPSYAKTRAFYEAMGFVPLEEIKTLWGEANPALLYIKSL